MEKNILSIRKELGFKLNYFRRSQLDKLQSSLKCPECNASSPSEMKIIGRRICLNNWHTRYPDKPVEVKYTGPIEEPSHPESPSEPAAPHSSQ